MTIEEMKRRKRELGYTNQMIADRSGIPLSTVQKVFAGATASPRRETIDALERVLENSSGERSGRVTYGDLTPLAGRVGEASAAYNVHPAPRNSGAADDRLHTLEDYLSLPDDQRVEMIDGVFYDMAAPTTVHQSVAGFLFKKLLDFVMENKGPCFPFMSPVDVQLDCDNRTMVEPDLLVICSREKIRMRCLYGAPDLAVEIVSPSSRRKDMILKTHKYEHAGVREYWIIDPGKRQVIVYDFANESYPMIYGFEDRIPVGIWEGDLTVDFAQISEEIAYLYEEGMESE